jgi:hypothetical protein
MKAGFKQHTSLPNDPNYDYSADWVNGSDIIQINEGIKNADVDASAAIAESKLSLDRSTASLGSELDSLIVRNTERNSAGWISGGEISLTVDEQHVNILAGTGLASNGVNFIPVVWNNFLNVVHVYNTYNYVSIKYDGTLSITATEQTSKQYVRLGSFWWDPTSSKITVTWNTPLVVGDFQKVMDEFSKDTISTAVVGLDCTEKAAPNQLQLNFAAGRMRVRLSPPFTFVPTSAFLKIYQCSDFYVVPDTPNQNNIIDTTIWADKTKTAATAITAMTTGYWAKAFIVVNTQGIYYYVYPEAEYATEDLAKAAPLPLFDALMADYNACICAIIYQKSATTIASGIIDLRPEILKRILAADLTFNKSSIGLSNVLNVAQEAVANKATNLSSDDDTHYPTVKAVNTGLAGITIDMCQVVLNSQVYGG